MTFSRSENDWRKKKKELGEKKSQTELEFNKSEVIFGPH